MPDRIYTYQQKLIIMYIEDLSFLLREPKRGRRQIKDLLESLKTLVKKDKSIPDRLKPAQYFKDISGLWAGRQMTPAIRVWLADLHTWIDDSHSKNAAR